MLGHVCAMVKILQKKERGVETQKISVKNHDNSSPIVTVEYWFPKKMKEEKKKSLKEEIRCHIQDMVQNSLG